MDHLKHIKQDAASLPKQIVALAVSLGCGAAFWFVGIELPGLGAGPQYVFLCIVVAVLCFWSVTVLLKADKVSLGDIVRGGIFRSLVILVCGFGGRLLLTYFPPWDGTAGALLGIVVAGIIIRRREAKPTTPPRFQPVRGNTVATPSGIGMSVADPDYVPIAPEGNFLSWAGYELSLKSAEGQFCTVGTPGSGKTLMQHELLRSVLPRITEGSDRRILIFDVKSELHSQLVAMNPPCPIRLMNPFDARCYAWDLAADFDDIYLLEEYAAAFIPIDPNDRNPFFAKAARGLLAGIFQILMERAPGTWTLRDVVHLGAEGDRLKELFQSSPDVWSRFGDSFKPEHTYQSTKQEFNNALRSLRTIASLWEQVPRDRHVSLKQWLKEESSILVLGAPPDRQNATEAINRAIFLVVSKIILSFPAKPQHDRLWFFIDELKDAGKLENLQKLITSGRSKGVRSVVGFQSLPGLREVYGRNTADDIVGNLTNTTFLRLECPETAEWASKRFGEREDWVRTTSISHDNGQEKKTHSESLQRRTTVLPGEFLSLPSVNDGVVEGFHIMLAGEKKQFSRSKTQYPFIPSIADSDYMPRGASRPLSPWTQEDINRLGLKKVIADTPPEAVPAGPSGADILKLLSIASKNWSEP